MHSASPIDIQRLKDAFTSDVISAPFKPGSGRDLPSDNQPGDPDAAASVAAVFHAEPDHRGLNLLFIQRAASDNDPWSAQMAFPGGRVQAEDHTTAATAERETMEELGLDLRPATRLGRLPNVDGGRAAGRPLQVASYTYLLNGQRPPLSPNYEVAEAIWLPVNELINPNRYIDYYFPPADSTFPGIQLDKDHQVIWGLTLRILGDLFLRLQHPFLV